MINRSVIVFLLFIVQDTDVEVCFKILRVNGQSLLVKGQQKVENVSLSGGLDALSQAVEAVDV